MKATLLLSKAILLKNDLSSNSRGVVMNIEARINALTEKQAYLIDIFPRKVPYKADNRYFEVERYFQHSKPDLYHKLTNIILKLYCYYDMTVVTHNEIIENPQTAAFLFLIEKCFSRESGYINIVLTDFDVMLILNNNDLYMTVYNANDEVKTLIAQLARAEGLFFYEASSE